MALSAKRTHPTPYTLSSNLLSCLLPAASCPLVSALSAWRIALCAKRVHPTPYTLDPIFYFVSFVLFVVIFFSQRVLPFDPMVLRSCQRERSVHGGLVKLGVTVPRQVRTHRRGEAQINAKSQRGLQAGQVQRSVLRESPQLPDCRLTAHALIGGY